jgi:DNA transposition AAA+ family ATPase
MLAFALGSLSSTSLLKLSADLVSESRLYRQTAVHAGETAMVNVLEDLERVLVEISHEPSRLSPERLEELRARLSEQGILLKIRVLGSSVRRDREPAEPGPQEL